MRRIRKTLLAVAVAGAAVAATVPATMSAFAAANHTVTFVNRSNQTVWIGSAVNADGSKNLTGLPTLAPGQSATVTIPENADPYHWRGKFFARTGCTGNSGSTFHCLVADCGPYADQCVTGEQPASLAEFNFDPGDSLAPWYNVSYVNAFSLPVTISPNNAPAPPAGGGSCEIMGCSEDLLQYCPSGNVVTNPSTGARMNCVNPNRDAQTSYSDAITSHCPKAYAWSKQDTVPGNKVMRQCSNCSGFTVTFGAGGSPNPTEPTGLIRGMDGKCIGIAGGKTDDSTPIDVYSCVGDATQQWTIARDGTIRNSGKCLDVRQSGTSDGTPVQIYTCNGTAAQQWVYSSGQDIVNPQANKCLDMKGNTSADFTIVHLWTCTGGANQKWSIPA